MRARIAEAGREWRPARSGRPERKRRPRGPGHNRRLVIGARLPGRVRRSRARQGAGRRAPICRRTNRWSECGYRPRQAQRSGEVEAVGVHHLGPGRDEVARRTSPARRRWHRPRPAPAAASCEPKTRSTRVPVHFSSPVPRSRPSKTSSSPSTGFHAVRHVEQVDEEVVGQRPRPVGEDAVRRRRRHWRRARAGRRPAPSSPARSASAAAPGRPAAPPAARRVLALQVVAEAVGDRLEHGEGLDVGLLLRWHPCGPGVNGTVDGVAGLPRRLLDRRRRRRGRSGRRARPSCRRPGAALNAAWMPSSVVQHLGELRRLVDLPVLLRREADARAVGAAALVGAAEGRGRGPGGRDQLARPSGPRRGSSP